MTKWTAEQHARFRKTMAEKKALKDAKKQARRANGTSFPLDTIPARRNRNAEAWAAANGQPARSVGARKGRRSALIAMLRLIADELEAQDATR